MSQLLKKLIQSKILEALVSSLIVYFLLVLLAMMNTDFFTIEQESSLPTTFFKLHKPKTVVIKKEEPQIKKNND